MITLHEMTEIDAAPETVWAAIHDYTRRLEWDTMLRRVAVDGQPPSNTTPVRAGSEITQWSKWSAGGVVMTARYDACQPPSGDNDAVATVVMTRGPWFFKHFTAHAVLKRRLDGGTRCWATYKFECRPKLLRAVIKPAVIFMFRRETVARWESLRKYVETGQREAVAA